MTSSHTVLLVVLGVWLAGCVNAERNVSSGASDPSAAAPPVGYRSAFDDFIAAKREPMAAWPEANETMRRLGGQAGQAGPEEDPHAGHGVGGAARPTGKPGHRR